MRYLFEQKEKFSRRFNQSKVVLLFLDYDGTLTPIVKKPEWATLSQDNKRLLRKLVHKKWARVAVVSGRVLKDVKKLVGIKGIVYAGNHGLRLEGPKLKYLNSKAAAFKKKLDFIYARLVAELGGIPKALIEHKGLTLSVHYRLVKNKSRVRKIFEAVNEITQSYVKKNKVRVSYGKKVIEVKPKIGWDKGKIVLWLIKYFSQTMPFGNSLVIYLGDDTTDEDAFKVLKNRGIGIFVGSHKKKSRAKFYLKNTREVTRFLEIISQRS